MGRVLASTVILTDENGQPKVFLAGDEPTKEYAKQIVNPKAWGEQSDDDVVDEAPEADVVDPDDDPEDDDPSGEGDDSDVEPAPAKSAKVDVWKAYAESRGVELGDDATKKDYQDAVGELDA